MDRYQARPFEVQAHHYEGDRSLLEKWASSLVPDPDEEHEMMSWSYDNQELLMFSFSGFEGERLEGEIEVKRGEWVVYEPSVGFRTYSPDLFLSRYQPARS